MVNEVKVIGVTHRWFIDRWYAQSACQAGWHVGVKGLNKDTHDGIELVDKAHITRLQDEHQGELAGAQAMLETAYAERDALKVEVEKFQAGCADLSSKVRELEHKMDYWKSQNDALQSELTKAQELMAKAAYMIECPNLFFGSEKPDMIEALTAHQSAPAAKDK